MIGFVRKGKGSVVLRADHTHRMDASPVHIPFHDQVINFPGGKRNVLIGRVAQVPL